VQSNANTLGDPGNSLWQSAASGDHDPFDMYRVDPNSFRLVPLIYSTGRDEAYGIQTADSYAALRGLDKRRLNDDYAIDDWQPLWPWNKVSNSVGYLGAALPEGGAADNIHNHLLGRR
jgi:hypothetical protein